MSVDAPMTAAEVRLAQDDAARKQALTLGSFIVQAPAGAGKTELLTQRILKLLEVVTSPEEVLAITFTNKAASEMRERILHSLAVAAAGGPPPEAGHKRLTHELACRVLQRDTALNWGLRANPGRLRVTTIDAWCLSLVRQMPYLSRFGAQPAIAEDPDRHYQRAVSQTLAMLEDGGPAAEPVAAALAFVDNDAARLSRLLTGMLARRDQWLRHVGRMQSSDFRLEVEAGFQRLFSETLVRAAACLTPDWQGRLMPLVRFAASQSPGFLDPLADWDRPLGPETCSLAGWQALARLLLTTEGQLRQSLDKRVGFPADKSLKSQKEAMLSLMADLAGLPGLVSALQEVLRLPGALMDDPDWATVDHFVQLLQLATAQLWLVFQGAGEVDFIEIAQRALMALGDEDAPTDLAQALDYRIGHILVDEFQDTSPLQVALLAALTRGWLPGDGRTLFVVGDPMQSIYRFRKADVGTFLTVRERGIGEVCLTPLSLCRNNRSHPAVVDWVNEAFSRIFPAADNPALGAVSYSPAVATREVVPATEVCIHPVLVNEDEAGDEAEADWILKLIRTSLADNPDQRIAVLVRARGHLRALVAAMRRTAPELRFQAVDIEGLIDRQSVQDLLALQLALWHRADRVHWLAVLRAPWCGLTLADLHALAGDDHQSTIWQLMHDERRLERLSADGRLRLQHVRTVFAEVLAARGRQSERRWLEGAWWMLGGAQTLSTPGELAEIEAVFGLIDRLVAAGRFDRENLLREIGSLYAPPDPLASPQLQMMTIHKAKGLEFETVIVPGLHRGTGRDDPSLLLWDEVEASDGQAHLLVAPMRQRGSPTSGPDTYDFLRRLESSRSAHEDARLLYVAATRAIARLHLVGVAERGEVDGTVKAPRQGTFLDLLWPVGAESAFLQAAAAGGACLPAETRDPRQFVSRMRRLRAPGLPDTMAGQPALHPEQATEPERAALPAFSPEISIGVLVHRCLELMVRQGMDHWRPGMILDRREQFARWLEARGHDRAEAVAGADVAIQALCTTLASADGRWVLFPHPEAGAEQAWSSVDEAGGTASHIIDRVFVADGCRWIIDYKTVRQPPDAPAGWLDDRAEGYRPQLMRYAGLFEGESRPVRLAIFFPVQGRLIELK